MIGKKFDNAIRYGTIDSMRGLLALAVFIHHSSIWYQYLHTGVWEGPKESYYAQLGSTSVALFFMITSFLFVSKLLNTNDKDEFNWGDFFMSRIFRLAPMYYFSIFLLFFCVFIATKWELRLGLLEFLKPVFDWGIFTITGKSKINDYDLTNIVNAGVVWTLPFEWLFYFCLPLVSLFILKRKPSKRYVLVGVLFIGIFLFFQGIEIHHFILSFACGAVAPFMIKYSKFQINGDKFIFSVIILVCFYFNAQFFTSDNIKSKILIAIIFTLVALGNTVFGVFKSSTLKFLGEICYSTYLLHGILLFVTFYFVIGKEKAKLFTPLEYCCVIFLITPILVFASYMGYKFIEKPFMDKSRNIILNRKKNTVVELKQQA